jgi:hypothetical protein
MCRTTQGSQVKTVSMRLRPVLLALAVLCSLGPATTAGADQAAPSLTLSWVGDIAYNSASGLPAGGPQSALAPVRDLLASDLTMGNLEGTLGSSGTTKCHGQHDCFAFQAPARYAAAFHGLGFRLFNQANNHANDAGPAGIRATDNALRAAGILRAGIGSAITRVTVNDIRLAIVGFSPYRWSPPLLDRAAAARIIRRADRGADVVIALIHAGAEGASRVHVHYGSEYAFGENRGDVRHFAHTVIAAGADLVLGSGPHVIRGIERFHDRLIAYSLGNFAGFHTLGTGGTTALSGILRLKIDRAGRVLAGRWISVRLAPPGLPRPDPSHASAHLVAALSRADFGKDRYLIKRDGTFLFPQRPL